MYESRIKMKKAILKCPSQYKAEFKDSKCSVTISVGQPSHEEEKFIATLAAVNKSFKECTIMVCDSLQRHTLKMDSSISDVHKCANKLGIEWVKRNEEIIKTLDIRYNIIHWDYWLLHSEYENARNQINQLFLSNEDFKKTVEETALSFWERNINKFGEQANKEITINNSCEYLKEECAVMLIWAKYNYKFELYTSPRNPAMRYVYQHVISKTDASFVREVTVKFKNSFLR